MKTILVIDDEPAILELFTEFFEDSKMRILTAIDGKSAELLVKKHLPNLIITDMLMPDKEGIEIVQQMKKQHPHIKIVTMSGMGNSIYLETSKMLGADFSITKPIDFKCLIPRVEKLLS